MLGLAPKLLTPRLALQRSITIGGAIYAAGLLGTAFASKPGPLVAAVLVTSLG